MQARPAKGYALAPFEHVQEQKALSTLTDPNAGTASSQNKLTNIGQM
jgi:hypothetical protein